MLLRLLATLAIVAIQQLSYETVEKIKDWMQKHGQDKK